ncbi:MAG TPA: amino acid adenylation domain-containing protein, partial [Thermoanaerobaculia bacterium]|nr:amino acid adenylation domain-containing protein [Thermoanaerobaculia bacterium]
LRDLVRRSLPEYMVPADLVWLDRLPLGPSGKVDRRALPAPDRLAPPVQAAAAAGTAVAAGDRVAPRTPAEELVAGLWAEVLEIDAAAVSVDDDFFRLGGHSLLAVRLAGRLRDLLGVEVALPRLLQLSRLEDLAREVESLGRAGRPPAAPIARLPRPPDAAAELPLSFAQERLWFLDQLDPGSAAYNEPRAMRLTGRLEVAALAASLGEIRRRHEVLRTRFAAHPDGQVVAHAVAASSPPPALPVVDLAALPPARAEQVAARLVTEEARRPFDLAAGPLLRAALLRLAGTGGADTAGAAGVGARSAGEERHLLLLNLHHTVSDGGSLEVLARELSVFYTAGVSGNAPPPGALPELPIQYADFAHWQRQWASGAGLAAELDWWREQLAGGRGEPAPLDLPLDRARPAVASDRGARRAMGLPDALAGALSGVARRHGVTLFMTLLAAFDALLYRYSGQSDVAVGTPVANRDRPEVQGLIGLFVNTLVLRLDLAGDPTWGELLARVRQTALAAYAHQDVPFDKLVGELAPQRGLAETPFFQVVFALQPAPPALALPGLAVEYLDPDSGTAKFDLSLAFHRPAAGGLAGTWTWRTDLFAAATVARIGAHWRQLLEELAGPDEPVAAGRRLSELTLLAAAERHQLLAEWNATAALAAAAGELVHLPIERQAAARPSSSALVAAVPGSAAGGALAGGGWQTLTYGELQARVNRLARRLRRLGVGPEQVVGVCGEPSFALVTGLLAILRAGGAYLPLDPSLPRERLARMVEDSGTRLVLAEEGLAEGLPEAVRVLPLARALADPALPVALGAPGAGPAAGGAVSPHPGNAAYVLYTSGSTGTPKGVVVPHRAVVNRLRFQLAADLAPGARVLQRTRLAFDVSVVELFAPLWAGATVVLTDPALRQDPGYLAAVAAEQQVTNLNAPPALLPALLAEEDLRRARAVRRVVTGGDRVPGDLPQRFFAAFGNQAGGGEAPRLFSRYGPTEATVSVSEWECLPPAAGAGPPPPLVPLGRPIAGSRFYLLDRRYLTGEVGSARQVSQELPVGASGELCIAGSCLARGYLGRPGLTAAAFIPDPFAARAGESGGRLYRTGDLARYRADGVLEFLGRLDHQVKIRGFRIELGEIEAALATHAAVGEAVVVVRRDPPGEARLVAYLVAARQPALGAAELHAWLGERLPLYMVPAFYVCLPALPLLPNGKCNRAALPAPPPGAEARAAAGAAAPVGPRTAAEAALAAIWAQVLGVEQVGVHDNFFALGGDSILSVQVAARARQAGLHLSIGDLFRHQTVAELAARAAPAGDVEPAAAAAAHAAGEWEATGETDAAAAGPEAAAGEVLLTPVQRRFFELDLPAPHHFNQSLLLDLRERIEQRRLAGAVAAVVRRHAALRYRYLPRPEGGWMQVGTAAPARLATVDLSILPAAHRRAALEEAAAGLQASLDLVNGPLVRAALFELGQAAGGGGQKLLLVLHHLIVDGVSWRILLADLEAACAATDAGAAAPALPPPPADVSYRLWAAHLASAARLPASAAEAEYWLAPARTGVVPLPVDSGSGLPGTAARAAANTVASARDVAVELDAEATRVLLEEVPAAYRTRIDDVLLTALAEAFAAWTGEPRLLVDLEGHGRADLFAGIDTAGTIGWFTAIYPVLLDLDGVAGDPGERLRSVKEQLRAVPRGGLGYGLLRYGTGGAPHGAGDGPELADRLRALPAAGVLFNYLGRLDRALPPSSLFARAAESPGPARSPLQRRSYLLEINGAVADGRLRFLWTYSESCHHQGTVEALAAGFLASLRILIAHCAALAAAAIERFTPSDFPTARVSQRDLDRVLEQARRTGSSRIERVSELSPVQHGILFHSLLAPDSWVYGVQLSLRLSGRLDTGAFWRAWRHLVARHGMLRTGFFWQELEKPLQVTFREAEIETARESWRGLDAGGQEDRLQRYGAADRERGFDLSSPPLTRLALFEMAAGDHRFLSSGHHLLLDGWSQGVLLRELFLCYEAFAAGREPALEPPRPYSEYLAWLQSRDLAEAEAYWRRCLGGFSSPTWLAPPDPRSAASGREDGAPRSATARRLQLRLPAGPSAALRELARRRRLTLNTLVEGAWALLLARMTAAPEVVFGVTLAGRPAELPGVESMVGVFINTLPLRLRVAPERRLDDWLAELQDQQVELLSHQHTPLNLVQRWSGLEAGTALFDHILVFENYPLDEALFGSLPGLAISEVVAEELTNYPLTVMVAPGIELSLQMVYYADRLAGAQVGALMARFEALLRGLAAAGDPLLGEMAVLLAAERQQLLLEWNDTESAPLRRRLDHACLHELIAEQARRTPAAPAVVADGGGSLTFAELARRAGRLARRLRQLGVGPETVVAICVERSCAMVVGLLAILEAGGAYLPLDPDYPRDRLLYMRQDAGAGVLLTTRELAARLDPEPPHPPDLPDSPAPPPPQVPAAGVTLLLDELGELEAAAPAGTETGGGSRRGERFRAGKPVRPENLAYVIYTSGSTGRPKGTMNAHRGIVNRLLWMQEQYGLAADDRVLQKTPFSFDVSVWELFWPLLVGARLVMARPGGHRDPAYLTQAIAAHGITTLHFVPSMLRAFLDHVASAVAGAAAAGTAGNRRLPTLRRVLASGEELPRDLQQQFYSLLEAPLHNLYGPTEAAVDVSFWPCDPASPRLAVPIGRPVANVRLHVLDRDGNESPSGVPGELHIGGVQVGRGYLGRPELTAERFVPDPFASLQPAAGDAAGSRLYRTGDLARHLSDGALEFLGRIDHQVKVRGFRIELGEIETALAAHPAVARAVVVADAAHGGRLVAYLLPRAGLDLAAVRRHAARQLPEHMIPGVWVEIATMPLTASGKVDRRALPSPEAAAGGPTVAGRGRLGPRAEGAAFVPPGTAAEELLAGIWSELLGVEQVGAGDDFFALGGHSLLATQLVSRLRRVLGVELPLRRVFEHPTLRALARELSSGSVPRLVAAAGRPGPAALAAGRETTLSYAQERIWFLEQLAPRTLAYHLSGALRFRGALDAGILRRCLDEIVCRHQVLRTVFPAAGGRPSHLVLPAKPLDVALVDFSTVPAASAAARVQTRRLMSRPFDLATGPLLRAALLRLGGEETVLLLSLHHIVADGWSVGIFLRELEALYAAFAAGRPSPLPALPMQYHDYARWQRGWLTGEVVGRHLAYWRQALAGAPAQLPLPTDRARPLTPSHRGGRLSRLLPPPIVEGLRRRARASGATLFMTLLGGWYVLLYRLTGKRDLVVGTPIANRERLEIEGLIGCFINPLALRATLSGSLTWSALAEQVRQVSLAAYAHQDLPFEKLIETLAPQRDLAVTPLFQVALVLQNTGSGAGVEAGERVSLAPGLTMERAVLDLQGAKFDLTLDAVEMPQGLELALEFSRDLFDPATARRLLGHYVTLLTALGADAGATGMTGTAGAIAAIADTAGIASLPLLSPPERHQLLEWNDTAAAYSEDRCLHELIEDQARRTPRAVAVAADDATLTYRALNARANRLARHLRSLGAGPETVVAVCLERSAALVAGLLAILKAGGAYLPLDPEYPAERLRYMREDSGARLLLTESRLLPRLGEAEGPGVVCLDRPRFAADAPAERRAAPWERRSSRNLPGGRAAAGPGNLAYVIYTSGSTGRPKGTMNTHRGIVNRLLWMQERYRLGARDRVLQKTPFSFDVSVWELFWPLLAGARLVMAAPGGHRDPDYLLRTIAAQRITTLHFVPSMLRAWLDHLGERGGAAAPRRRPSAGGAAAQVVEEDAQHRRHEMHGGDRLLGQGRQQVGAVALPA